MIDKTGKIKVGDTDRIDGVDLIAVLDTRMDCESECYFGKVDCINIDCETLIHWEEAHD